jgi:ubiquinone/menaquinone biosynthesis C-methylase UbiE/uncharacterized protein YbaR (Trm112 family)
MNLSKYFACPRCKEHLVIKEDFYVCKACQENYPIKNGIPIFLIGHSTDSYSQYWDSGWKKRFNEGDHTFHKKSDREYDEIVGQNLEISRERKTPVTFIEPIDKELLLLNIGCGMDEASLITKIGVNNYIGIDYSYSAAKYSKESIKKLNGLGVTAQANAEVLPILSESVDIVYSSGVLHHTPNIGLTVREIFRVLKPSGMGVIGLYSTYSPKFIVARIVGSIKSIYSRQGRAWYELTEEAWKTEEKFNPWTETFSKKQMILMFEKHGCTDLTIRSTGFQWGDSFPIFGKYIANTTFGRITSTYLNNRLGSMWVVTFIKQK